MTIYMFSYVLKASKNPFKANLDAQYAVLDGNPNFPESEEITIIFPFECLIWGRTAWVRFTFA